MALAPLSRSACRAIDIAELLLHPVFHGVLRLRQFVRAVGQLVHLARGVLLLHSTQHLLGVPQRLRRAASLRLRGSIALLALRRRLIGRFMASSACCNCFCN